MQNGRHSTPDFWMQMAGWTLVPWLSSGKARDSSNRTHDTEAWLSYCESWSYKQNWIGDRFDPLIDYYLDQICKYCNIGAVFFIPATNTQSFEDPAFVGKTPYM